MANVINTNGRRGTGRAQRAPMSEINVTPMVDVMLVLLVIFMITAPLLTVGIPVDLPETSSQPLKGDDEPLTVTVDVNGVIYLQETEVTLEEIVPRLRAIAGSGYDQRIYVRGDSGVGYGAVMKVMGRINGAGFTRIGLVTEMEP